MPCNGDSAMPNKCQMTNRGDQSDSCVISNGEIFRGGGYALHGSNSEIPKTELEFPLSNLSTMKLHNFTILLLSREHVGGGGGGRGDQPYGSLTSVGAP